MKIRVPGTAQEDILYERSLNFENIGEEGLESLLNGLKTALDLVCENKLKTGDYSVFGYFVAFYRENTEKLEFFEKLEFLGKPIKGLFDLTIEGIREAGILMFQKEYNSLIEEVREDYRDNPGSINLHAEIKGYKLGITCNLDEKSLFSRN